MRRSSAHISVRHHAGSRTSLIAMLALLYSVGICRGGTERSQTFDADPGWDGLRNRSAPNPGPTVTQIFGFRSSSNAGGAAGELGGSIARTTTPAWYADVVSTPKTLNDLLTASGRISLPSQ